MSESEDKFAAVTFKCDTAKQFVRKLEKLQESWRDTGRWIFRGHNDARWELKPSLYRLLNADDEYDASTYNGIEIELVRGFITDLHLASLPVPSNSLGYFSRGDDNVVLTRRFALDGIGDVLGYDYAHVAFAVAQHFGIPTRLLTFTHDPLVAAYFAADRTNLHVPLSVAPDWKEVAKQKVLEIFEQFDHPMEIADRCTAALVLDHAHFPTEIAVWAIRQHELECKTSLRVLHHSNREIPNLSAQDGVFVCDIGNEKRNGRLFQAFDNQLSELIESRDIVKYTLHDAEVEPLQRLLERKRRSPLYVRPSYEAIADKICKQVAELRRRGRQSFATGSHPSAVVP